MAKDSSLNELEQSLINFLCSKKDISDKVSGGARRIRGLTLGMDMRDPNKPCFTIQIGMCEAAFNAQSGLKEKGNCFGIERYVRDWFERPSVNNEFSKFITSYTKTKEGK